MFRETGDEFRESMQSHEKHDSLIRQIGRRIRRSAFPSSASTNEDLVAYRAMCSRYLCEQRGAQRGRNTRKNKCFETMLTEESNLLCTSTVKIRIALL